jgi:hypothetical protein
MRDPVCERVVAKSPPSVVVRATLGKHSQDRLCWLMGFQYSWNPKT